MTPLRGSLTWRVLLFTETTEVNLRSHPNTDSKLGNEVLLLIQSSSLGRNIGRMA